MGRAMEITLKLDLENVNVILTSLAERPYKEVQLLIPAIQHAAMTQVNGNAAPLVADPVPAPSRAVPPGRRRAVRE